ncbi:MAG: glycosyltransferase family 2 protein [Ignavibacteriae bacterium]|nr:glycosyltransferase family 2 protein [Ignavibacteriota bacterium]
MKTIGLSVIVITKNEERNIRECLESVKWADEIIVVDSQSNDRTVEIAREFTENIFVIEWKGYGETKNFALTKVTNEWVFWLDADERVPKELADEIKLTIQSSREMTAYKVARRAYFLGKWIKHCGWYPGYVVRLFKKDSAQFTQSLVHEKVEIAGTFGQLQHDLLHYTDDNLFHYFSKFNNYTSLAAEEMKKSGRNYSLWDVLTRPPFLFFKMYFLRLGFLDGMHGFILSAVSAFYVFVKYGKLWELYRHNSEKN